MKDRILAFAKAKGYSINISTRKILDEALTSELHLLFMTDVKKRESTVCHITTWVDEFIYEMVENYSSINNISKSEAVARLIDLVFDTGLL